MGDNAVRQYFSLVHHLSQSKCYYVALKYSLLGLKASKSTTPNPNLIKASHSIGAKSSQLMLS